MGKRPLTADLLNVYEAAALIGVSVATAYNWLRAGQLPEPVKVSGRLRWRRRDLEAWARRGFQPPRPRPTAKRRRRVEA